MTDEKVLHVAALEVTAALLRYFPLAARNLSRTHFTPSGGKCSSDPAGRAGKAAAALLISLVHCERGG